MKLPRLKKCLFWAGLGLLAGIAALIWLTPIASELRIHLASKKYYDWVEENRPYLKRLASDATFERKVELYSDGQNLGPYIFYDVVFGQTDGLVEFAYKLNVDRNFSPKGIKSEDISVILLPAAKQRNIEGRVRNTYWGRYIRSEDVAALVERIVSGDRLLDIRESIRSAPDYPYLRWADTDPWVKLTSGRAVDPSVSTNAVSPRR